jgi:hypothetical protein
MPAVAPSFVTSGTPLSSWFDPGPDYGTDPDSIDPATLPDGWTPQGAALMGGDVTRSPLEQAQWNMSLQGVANQFGQTQAANQFLQGAAGADPTTPDGITSIERLLTPEAAADPRVQAYIREARLARQTALMGTQGRGAPLPPAGAAFLARLGTLDPSDPNAWNQLSSDVNAHPEWLQNPQVAADFKDFRDRRNAVMTRRNTQPKGKSEQDLEDMAAMAGIPYEEVPRTPEGAVDRYPLLQRIAVAKLGRHGGQPELAPHEDTNLRALSDAADAEASSDVATKAKLAWLQKQAPYIADPSKFTAEQWDQADQAVRPTLPATRRFIARAQQLALPVQQGGLGKIIPADLQDKLEFKPVAGLARPTTVVDVGPQTLSDKLAQEQQKQDQAPFLQRQFDLNPLWNFAKSDLESRLTDKLGPNLPLAFNQIAIGKPIAVRREAKGGSWDNPDVPHYDAVDPIDYTLQLAGISPNTLATTQDASGNKLPLTGIDGTPITNHDLMRALYQERREHPRIPVTTVKRIK